MEVTNQGCGKRPAHPHQEPAPGSARCTAAQEPAVHVVGKICSATPTGRTVRLTEVVVVQAGGPRKCCRVEVVGVAMSYCYGGGLRGWVRRASL